MTCNDLMISFGNQRENKSWAVRGVLGSDNPSVFISRNTVFFSVIYQPHLSVFTMSTTDYRDHSFPLNGVKAAPSSSREDAALNFALCKCWRCSLLKRCEISRRGGENQHQRSVWFVLLKYWFIECQQEDWRQRNISVGWEKDLFALLLIVKREDATLMSRW